MPRHAPRTESVSVRIVPLVALAAGLVGCAAWNAERMRPLAIGVAAAEFRVREARWPDSGSELVAAACRNDRVLARLSGESAGANRGYGTAACLQEFAEPRQQIALVPITDGLRVEVRDRETGALCRMTVRYAGDRPTAKPAATAQIRTTLFQCG